VSDGWVRYGIPGSEQPWFHHPEPCPLDYETEPHLHAQNADGSWGVSMVLFAQLGITPDGQP
jgi:hypothetical protein